MTCFSLERGYSLETHSPLIRKSPAIVLPCILNVFLVSSVCVAFPLILFCLLIFILLYELWSSSLCSFSSLFCLSLSHWNIPVTLFSDSLNHLLPLGKNVKLNIRVSQWHLFFHVPNGCSSNCYSRHWFVTHLLNQQACDSRVNFLRPIKATNV